jgi:GTP-binding protein YchF
MKVGIIGLPNVGKSSLFNLLTDGHAQVANFPFTTIERNIGMAPITDQRLTTIGQITQSTKITYAHLELVDIAGLIKGASRGEGLGNTFLSHIRDVDLILHMVRGFRDPQVPHIDSEVIPEKDYDIVRSELFLSDLELTERRMKKIKKRAECQEEYEQLCAIHEILERGIIPSRQHIELPLIAIKDEIVVLNLDENARYNGAMEGYRISVRMEEDIVDMSEEEKKELRREINADTDGVKGLIQQCCAKLSLITFYTIKGEEARAWLLPEGSTALTAASRIHSDMEKGFIKAEVLAYDDFITSKGFAAAQHNGKTRIEGKDYIVQNGEIILVKFRS